MAQVSLNVVSVSGDKVVLEGQRQSACSSCASKNSCVTVNSETATLLRAELTSPAHYKVGQQVDMNCHDSFLLKAIMVMFAPALCGLLGFALLANYLFAAAHPHTVEYINLGAALLGFVSGLLLSRYFAQPLIGQLNQQLSLRPTTSCSKSNKSSDNVI
ncbi:SoxR reducing system RseC family protein [Agarivorans sp. 1_MG-2023]|uniref:SoxR reducing system RseC family protein n=1 Tax=Agarivorans sp. 1_MG-2023 TaxID=3062634 RepID=UPI0026E2A66D|nr:SoxR reducing system RseC family protein [Agarivorans sp. 1_MG-2023]MDO6762232.1 SoxR reducing system RseC family protein [Agarivorans sp. 1_MG-2023]